MKQGKKYKYGLTERVYFWALCAMPFLMGLFIYLFIIMLGK